MVKTIDRGTFHRRSIRQGTRDRQERYLGLVECVLQDAGWPFTDPDKGSLVVSFHDPVRLLEAVWTVDIHGMECSDDRAEIKRPALWVRKSLVTKESRNGRLKDRIPRRLRRVCRGAGLPHLSSAGGWWGSSSGRQTLERDQSMAGIRMRSTTETETLETENGAR